MDHVDLINARDVGSSSSLRILYVFLPYSCRPSGDGASSPLSFTSMPLGLFTDRGIPFGASKSSWLLAKPTLDPSCIRFCPEERWVPDAHVVTCMAHECNVTFSLFNRKHHCRVCGRIFCSACCSHTIKTRGRYGWYGRAIASSSAEDLVSNGFPTTSNCNVDPHPLERLSSYNGNGNFSESSSCSCSSSKMRIQQQKQRRRNISPSSVTSCRICSACYHEVQLVVSRRDHHGELRRKCRGELKMMQWPLLVKVLSYLDMHDLLEASLVSSDFYFISRDNVIWYQYNMLRCRQEELQSNIPVAQSSSLTSSLRQRLLKRPKPQTFRTEFGEVTSTDSSRRVLSLHARYNFTHFLDFAHRREMARCKGLSSFSAKARMLLSSPLKIAIIGPSGIGKTSLVHQFVGQQEIHTDTWSSLPTMGFVRHEKIVHLVGDLTTDVMLHIFDISGEPRFTELRRFICSNCHAVGLCYDARRKVTLAEAASLMLDVEPALGPQPIVVCGIVRPVAAETRMNTVGETGERQSAEMSSMLEVSEMDAEGITVRGRGSIHCTWNDSVLFFQQLLQSLLDCLALPMAIPPSLSESADVSEEQGERTSTINCRVAQELLDFTASPSALDLLMDRK